MQRRAIAMNISLNVYILYIRIYVCTNYNTLATQQTYQRRKFQ